MGSQPENASVYSMCNCITLGMPDTYTAHALSMDAFLAHAAPGARWPRPHVDLWPKTFIKVFKFPPRVRVFVFSVFNEVYLPSYVWREGLRGERFTMGFNGKYEPLRRLAIPVRALGLDEFCERLQAVGRKADAVWPGVRKVLLRYDKARAGAEVRDSFAAYERAVEAAVDWPVVGVHDPHGPPARPGRPHMWCHYSQAARNALHGDILKAAKDYEPRRSGDGTATGGGASPGGAGG